MSESLRDTLLPGDRDAVAAIVAGSGFFNDAERVLAVELVDEALARGPAASGYHFLFAEIPSPRTARRSPLEKGACEDRVLETVGYACYGPIAGTLDSFDLYWIAVTDEARGRGVGRQLLEGVVDAVRAGGGRRLYAETSSRAQYEPTRRFYRSTGFREEALLEDFYAPGDGKVIYLRLIDA